MGRVVDHGTDFDEQMATGIQALGRLRHQPGDHFRAQGPARRASRGSKFFTSGESRSISAALT